ncbi:MAG: hypothetical protein J7J86_08210 [Bacteroidales bacterium]|nr:hypothetical protein [Bacteroidales bacterium]
MSHQDINKILEKYYKGETSLKEEKILHNFFNDNKKADNSFVEKDIFQYFDNEKNQKIENENFSDELIEKLVETKIIKFRKSPKEIIIMISSIAACFLIIFFFYIKQDNTKINAKNSQIAYAETKIALLAVSEKLNYGLNKTHNLNKINTGIKNLNKISKINTGLNELKKIEKFNKGYELLNKIKK